MWEAAQILGMPFDALDEHPRKAELMSIAFTVQGGRNEGEYLRELNPKWAKKRKEASKALEKAQKK